ncbi:MAG: DJ-1/PfpI family protein [Planctomycetota bacterium]
MIPNVGIVVFDGAEELDFVGPWEVFAMATRAAPNKMVHLVAETLDPVTCAKGMRVLPDCTLSAAPPLDIIVVPGGHGARAQLENEVLLGWLNRRADDAQWIASVCTGTGILVRSGLAKHKRVTTHWSWVEALKGVGPCEVLTGVRYVRDGKIVSSAGVSAGIDMSLWIVGQVMGIPAARETQHMIEYDPAPPYAAEV